MTNVCKQLQTLLHNYLLPTILLAILETDSLMRGLTLRYKIFSQNGILLFTSVGTLNRILVS